MVIYFIVAMAIVLFISLFFILFTPSFLTIVREYERGVKFRFGSYVATLKPGVHLIIPRMESVVRIDMRIRSLCVSRRRYRTRRKEIVAGARVNYRVTEADKVVLNLSNAREMVEESVERAMANVFAECCVRDIMRRGEFLAAKVRERANGELGDVGMEVNAIELEIG